MYLSFLFFLCIFSFPSFFRYIVLVHKVLWPLIDIHCTYFLFYDVDVCFSFTYHFMCCFFSPFIHMFLIFVCNLLLLFHTKMPWWVSFKVFQKYRLSKSTCHKLSSCKVFQGFMLGYTKVPWWVLFKVFQKYRLSKSTCHKLSSCKVFQEFMLKLILLYSTSEYELSDLWLLSYAHLFVVVCHGLPKGEIVRTYVFHIKNICHDFM